MPVTTSGNHPLIECCMWEHGNKQKCVQASQWLRLRVNDKFVYISLVFGGSKFERWLDVKSFWLSQVKIWHILKVALYVNFVHSWSALIPLRTKAPSMFTSSKVTTNNMPIQSKHIEGKDDPAWSDHLSPRDQSRLRPVKIGPMAHPLIHAGYDQCFDCGNFGHRRDRGAGCTSKVKRPPPFSSWRRVTTGKDYSLSMLEMTPEGLAKARHEVIAMEGTPG